MALEPALEQPPTGARARFDAETGALLGTRCADCGAVAWPGRAVCHRCGSASVEQQAFDGTAELLSYTEVMVARPGIEAPYLLGQMRLANGPIVFGRVVGLHEDMRLPCAGEVRARDDGAGGVVVWFEPEER